MHFIYIAWIGASAAIRERAHIRIDFLLPLLSNKWRTIVFIIGDLATFVLAVVALYWSMEPVINSIHFGSVDSRTSDQSGVVPFCRAVGVWNDDIAPHPIYEAGHIRPPCRATCI